MKARQDSEHDIELVEDIKEALRLISEDDARVILGQNGKPVAAVIPMDDLRLLLRLEEEELDRIDAARLEEGYTDPDNRTPIPWDAAKLSLDL